MNYKSFVNHKHNGIHLKFPNGNSISTIWGRGSYTDNHDFTIGEDIAKEFSTLFPEGSNTVEIMLDTNNKRLRNRIFRRFNINPDNGVIGWLTIDDWMWVIQQLYKMEVKSEK